MKTKQNAAHKAHATRRARVAALLAIVKPIARSRGPMQKRAQAALEAFAG